MAPPCIHHKQASTLRGHSHVYSLHKQASETRRAEEAGRRQAELEQAAQAARDEASRLAALSRELSTKLNNTEDALKVG